jgi:GntR family transcriptional regulator/MocR family aminotransferase
MELRTALAGYLGRVRGVQARPTNIVVTGGITQGLALLSRVLDEVRPGRPVAVEDPGFWFHRGVLASTAAGIVPLPVDRDGADARGLVDAGAVLVTPAHQYPTGVTMTAPRRRQLLSWATSNDAVVIEDDYDGELRHDRMMVPALQADAPDRVIFAGTASKALGPGLRLGWLVIPDALVDVVGEIQRNLLYSLDVTGQLGLANFITHHGYDQRVRAIRATYRRRLDQLETLVTDLSDSIPGLRLSGERAGGQASLYLPPHSPSERDIIDIATDARLRLEGLEASSHVPGAHPPGLLIGYSAPADHRYIETLEVLARVLREAG